MSTAKRTLPVTVSHGISTFGDLKYPAGFPHFDYVNPDAPKGDTMSFRGTGASLTFDSLNPWILKGEPAQGLALMYDSLLAGSADEPDSAYGFIATTLDGFIARRDGGLDWLPQEPAPEGRPHAHARGLRGRLWHRASCARVRAAVAAGPRAPIRA